MNERTQVFKKPKPQRASQPLGSGVRVVLQRKCSCGGTTASAGGECDECKKEKLQRRAISTGGPMSAPPIVHQVLNSPGQPLDAETRSFFEPRFGHNFGHIRVHTDDRAAESARAINALAYTVGRDVVFAAGQYTPYTHAGSRLLAHELTHTLQNEQPAELFPFLAIGPVDDPSERAADSMADAVMRGQRTMLTPSAGGILRRQPRSCSARPADRPDRRIVSCSDGNDYRVTLTATSEPRRPETRTSVDAGFNDTSIYLNIDLCRGGTAVRITPNIDGIPQAVAQVLGNILAGSGALTGVTLTPGLQITIVQSQSFTLTLGPTMTVGQSGVTGVGGRVGVQTPDVNVSVGGTYDPKTHAWGLNFTFSGGSPQRTVDCTRQGRQRLVFTCERITHVPPVPEVPERTTTDTEVRYLFFDYKTDNIRRNFRPLPTDIQSLYDQGYRITSVEGFTSPEGPRPAGPNFEGNIELSRERARRALRWLREEVCTNCDLSGVSPQGRSELPSQQGAVEPEPTGRPMERGAVAEFLGRTPGSTADPLAPRTPADVAAFQALPQSQQRERAFQLMRRAAITLKRTRVTQQGQAAVPARDEFNRISCDRDVIDTARAAFGISIVTGAVPARQP